MSQTLAATNEARSQITWSQAALTWTQVLLPTWARRVSISCEDSPISFVVSSNSTLTDGDPFVSNAADNAEELLADAKIDLPVTPGQARTPQASVFVRVSVNPTVITVSVSSSSVS